MTEFSATENLFQLTSKKFRIDLSTITVILVILIIAMKLVHLSLLALVCFGAVFAEMTQVSHAIEKEDLGFLETAEIEQIMAGELVLVTHGEDCDFDSYIPPSPQTVLHTCHPTPETFTSKIIKYTSAGQSSAIAGNSGDSVVVYQEPTQSLEVLISSPEAAPTKNTVTETVDLEEPAPPTAPKEASKHETIVTSFAPEWTNSLTESSNHDGEEPLTIIRDGKVITIYNNPKQDDGSAFIFIEVDDLWAKNTHTSTNATELVLKFAEVYGKELSLDEYSVLNKLVTTPDKKYWSQYNYWRVRKDQIEKAVTAISLTFSSKVNNRDVKYFANLVRECKHGYVAATLNTETLDINNADKWEIHAEMLIATCSADNEKYQLFGWSGSKTGLYVSGAYSESNKKSVRDFIRRWLFAHAGLLVSCTKSPIDDMAIWSHPKLILRSITPAHDQLMPIMEMNSAFD
jgi:hypothetical protein